MIGFIRPLVCLSRCPRAERTFTRLFRPPPFGYSRAMSLLIGLLLFLATIAAMEGAAYVAHRWVMHGPGWFLHASHHRPRHGMFEANDLYAVIFALPSIVLLLGGVQLGWGAGFAWVGAGIAAYGAIYFGFHDVIVHQRVRHRYVPRGRYMKRIVAGAPAAPCGRDQTRHAELRLPLGAAAGRAEGGARTAGAGRRARRAGVASVGAITHAQIEPTTRCNFTCGFCAGRSMRQGDLAWEAFAAFLDAHPDLAHVELQGEGEPLLHPRFFDMAAACTARGLTVGLITNGSLLSETMVERLLDAGLAAIHISLETTDPARFQAIRGGLYTKVAEGIARLACRRRERGLARPVIGLAVTVLADTIEDIHGIYDLYEANGLDGGLSHQLLQSMPAYSDRYDPAMAARLVPPARWPEVAAIRAAISRQAPLAPDYFYASLFRGFDSREHDCPWLDHGVYLGNAGTVAACCFVKHEALGAAGDVGAVAARRAALSEALHQGEVPAPCRGCSTATAIAHARAQAGDRQNAPVRAEA